MNTTTLHTLFSRIDTYQKYLIQIQKELTAIPGLGPDNEGDGEKNKAEFIKTILEKISPDSLEEVNAPDTRVPCGYRPNLFAKFTGKTSVKTIWIMSHMDIVPPGDLSLWDNDPYQVIEKNGKLFGRGTEDNQQGLVSSILAVKALRDENLLAEYDVGLAIVSDEETGSEYGISSPGFDHHSRCWQSGWNHDRNCRKIDSVAKNSNTGQTNPRLHAGKGNQRA
jgi:succinyl-diaminopimelate desuccinylase